MNDHAHVPADLLSLLMTGALLYELLANSPETEDDPAPGAWFEGLEILRSFGGDAALRDAVMVCTAALNEGGYGR